MTHGVSDSVGVYDGRTAGEAAAAAYGTVAPDEVTALHTSHFNFDNRALSGDQHPPTTNKYHCVLEARLLGGGSASKWYATPDLRTVRVGELDLLDVNRFQIRVTQCRFWWKLSPGGQWHHSEWVRADPGYFIVYAFLVWHGRNEYERPVYYYQESLE